jgi:phage terminase small subunit
MSARKQPKPSNIVEFKTDPRKGLTYKQAKFCELYAATGKKGESAIKAGYSAKSAIWQVNAMLESNILVREYLRFLLHDQTSDMVASISEAQRRLSLAARGEMKEEVIVMETIVTHKLDKRGKKVTVTKTKPKIVERSIQIRDSLKAAELLYGVIADAVPEAIADARQSKTDEALLKALNRHQVTSMPDLERVVYEEDEPDVPAVNPA